MVAPIEDEDDCEVVVERDDMRSYCGNSVLYYEHTDIDNVNEYHLPSDVALLDEAKLQYPLRLRRWREGDSFIPFGMAGRKKVGDYLTDQKVPIVERKRQFVLVSGEDISALEDISDKTGVNEEMKMDIAQGYRPRLPDGVFDMGTVRFEASDSYGNAHRANEEDVERVLKAIREARENADYVLLSLHTHEMTGKTIENIPTFIKELSHRFIDGGAHAVVGHGPHLLRAIEVYRDRPIFY